MKKTLLLCLMVALAAGVNGMENMFRNGVLHFDYKAEDLVPTEAKARERLEKELADLVAIPDEKRTFENTIMGYERAFEHYGDALGMSGFCLMYPPIKTFVMRPLLCKCK